MKLTQDSQLERLLHSILKRIEKLEKKIEKIEKHTKELL